MAAAMWPQRRRTPLVGELLSPEESARHQARLAKAFARRTYWLQQRGRGWWSLLALFLLLATVGLLIYGAVAGGGAIDGEPPCFEC